MNPKMKSAIEKITLNDATFSNEVIEPTYVNFFYGKNGAGKSTIARTFKANDEHLQWQAGKASTDYDVLVYDTDFINANLRNYGNLAGVFTVNETNIAIQEQVDTLNAERKKMGEEYNGHKAAIDQKTADKNTALSTFQSDCWSKSAEARTLFDEAIKGKKKAALFTQEILAITPVAHNFDELKALYGTVFSGDAQQYNMLSKAGKVTYASLPGYELMSKPISSSSDTDFAKFIKALKATDWVRSGHTHFAGQTDGKCPYCQQKLPLNFDKEIAACFDAQYQDDISAINAFQRTYAKYYSHTTQVQFDKHTLHSNNLYQIFTYVKNRSYQFGEEKNTVSGMLLYAKTEEEIQPDNVYQMNGSQISVKTLDLNQPFAEIANQMDRIVESHFSGLAKKY